MPPPSKPKPSVFGDLDDDNSKDMGAQLREKKEQDRRERQVGSQICITRQFLLTSIIKIAAERAKVLAEDATAYDYDGVYDDMKQTAKQQTEKKAADRSRRQVRKISFLIQLFFVTHPLSYISPNISITY